MQTVLQNTKHFLTVVFSFRYIMKKVIA